MSFIDDIKAKAIELYNKYGILPSVSISQAVLESGSGTSGLTKKANNLFGIKGSGTAGSVEMPTKEVINGKTETVLAEFRAYNNWNESLDDYGKLIGTASRYEGVRTASDYKTALTALGSSGYATDPSYSGKLATIINDNQLYNIDAEVTGKNAGASDPFDNKDKPTGDGTEGFFELGADGWLDSIGEWLKSAGFVLVGLVLLALGVVLLFGIGNVATVVIDGATGGAGSIAKEVLKDE